MDLWLLTALALVTGIACLIVGLRQGRAGWPTLLIGLLLLGAVCFVAFLLRIAD